jgi:hypothetical protein
VRVSKEGVLGASGWDAPGDCGTGASARSPLSLRGQVALQSPLVFYFTQDAKMVSFVGHDASPCSVGWGLGDASRTRCGCRTSGC